MSSFFDEIAAKLATLSGVASPEVSREELNEFNVRDVQAVRVSEGGSGGAATMKHVVVPVTFADIDEASGFADLYLLPENETIMASWPVVTTVFNGTAGGFNFTSAQAAGPNGIGVASASLGDAFDATILSVAIDGIIGPDPTGGPGASTIKMVPLAAPDPGGGSVQTIIDFPAQGGVVTVPGTTGALDYHLVISIA